LNIKKVSRRLEMPDGEPPRTKIEKIDADNPHDLATLYSALVAMYLHQDRLLWSRTQLLIAIQGAVLAAGFSLRSKWFAPAIMLLGALLTFLIMVLVIKDQADRDVNLPLLKKLNEESVPERLKNLGPVKLTSEPPFNLMRGRYIIKIVLIIFILIDILLAVLFIWARKLFT
jgi:hypothetical protein